MKLKRILVLTLVIIMGLSCLAGCKKEKLYSAPITSEGMANALKRARQLTELEWDCLEEMPRLTKENGTRIYTYFEKGKQSGIPYSSVYETNTYVGTNVSIETFISATCNPNSYLYTKNLHYMSGEPKAVTFYGMVCSKYAGYVLGIKENYNAQHFDRISGMNKISAAKDCNLAELQRCDILLNKSVHTAVITDILSDKKGNIKYVEVSEETTVPQMQRKAWTVEEFYEKYKNYDVYRYEYLKDVKYEPSNFVNVFDENKELDDRKYDVLSRYGDKANIYLKDSSNIDFDILTDGWENAKVYYNGEQSEIDVSGKKVFSFSPSKVGYYQVILYGEDKESRPCYFCVVDSQITANGVDKTLTVEYSSENGKPIYMQLGSVGDSVYIPVESDGTQTVNLNDYYLSESRVLVAFENEYGVYVSKGIWF